MRRLAVLLALAFATPTLAAPVQPTTAGIGYYIGKYRSASASAATTIDLSDAQIRELRLPYLAAYAQSAYCGSVNEKQWVCGSSCSSTGETKVLWTDGDNRAIPYAYLAYSSILQSVIVAHAGSNFDSLRSICVDADIPRDVAGPDLDDGQSQDGPPSVHGGFYKVWRKTKHPILTQVKQALAQTGAKSVITTGHSLGAAISQMDAVFLRQKLPKSVTVSNIGFGEPRVGDEDWAKLVDRVLGNAQAHVIHKNDVVSRLPPKAFGFSQAKNEIWIASDDMTVLCKDNDSEDCSNGVSQWKTSASAHRGPYFGIEMNGGLCR